MMMFIARSRRGRVPGRKGIYFPFSFSPREVRCAPKDESRHENRGCGEPETRSKAFGLEPNLHPVASPGQVNGAEIPVRPVNCPFRPVNIGIPTGIIDLA